MKLDILFKLSFSLLSFPHFQYSFLITTFITTTIAAALIIHVINQLLATTIINNYRQPQLQQQHHFSVVSGNLNGPVIMMAEKLADAIKGAAPLPASDAPVWSPKSLMEAQRGV